MGLYIECNALNRDTNDINSIDSCFILISMIWYHEYLRTRLLSSVNFIEKMIEVSGYSADFTGKDKSLKARQRTCKLFTLWNLTNLKATGFPSFTDSSSNSSICATAGSSASATSSKPKLGRLIASLIFFGACATSLDLIMMDFTRTDWLNW